MSGIFSKLAIFSGLMAGVITLAACESGSLAKNEADGAATTTKRDALGRPFVDVMAKFVVNTPPGQTGIVTLENNETVRVRVGTDYVSAANEQCRHMIVQFPDGRSQANAVCFNGAAWKTVLGKM